MADRGRKSNSEVEGRQKSKHVQNYRPGITKFISSAMEARICITWEITKNWFVLIKENILN